MQDYILRCKAHREEAVKLLPMIHPESRKSPTIMVSVYSQLVKQAEKLCGEVVFTASWFDRYAESQRADVYSWGN